MGAVSRKPLSDKNLPKAKEDEHWASDSLGLSLQSHRKGFVFLVDSVNTRFGIKCTHWLWQSKSEACLGRVPQAYNLSSGQAEAGGLLVWGQPEYIGRPSFKKKAKEWRKGGKGKWERGGERRKEERNKEKREEGKEMGGRERTFSLNAELSPSSPWKHFCLSVFSPRVTTSSSNGYFSLRSHYRRWPWRDESCDSLGSPSCTVVPPSSHLLGHTCFCRHSVTCLLWSSHSCVTINSGEFYSSFSLWTATF